MKKIAILMFILSCLAINIDAQDFTAIRMAFARSYSAETDKKYDEAINELTKVYNENSYEINLRIGWLSYLAGSYMESVEFYLKAINLKPYAIEPRLGFAYPASALGNWSQVEEQYATILSIDPMNTQANYWMGMIYYNRQQFDAALNYFEKVVNLFPFDYDSTIMYAWTNLKMHNLREAKILFQQALLIKPGDTSALEGLGIIQ